MCILMTISLYIIIFVHGMSFLLNLILMLLKKHKNVYETAHMFKEIYKNVSICFGITVGFDEASLRKLND